MRFVGSTASTLRHALLLCALSALASANSPLNLALPVQQQTAKPEWCKKLPRPEYEALERVPTSETWFEVYKVAPNVYAIYEPHQSEETISYLILGTDKALLFDTGMGIGDMKILTAELTTLPVLVLNSHTHNDHVGGNWQFDTVLGMDTDFTRANAQGSRGDAQAEIAPGEICGELPKDFDPESYATKPWKISRYVHDGEKLDLGGRTLEIITTPGHTPDSICLYDAASHLLFTGDTYYPGTIWLYRPETDLLLYESSIARLEYQPRNIQTLLGAHNLPTAPGSVLPILAVASTRLRAMRDNGKGRCKSGGPGKKVCKVDSISFLLRAEPR